MSDVKIDEYDLLQKTLDYSSVPKLIDYGGAVMPLPIILRVKYAINNNIKLKQVSGKIPSKKELTIAATEVDECDGL